MAKTNRNQKKDKKDIWALNVCISRDIHSKLEDFCMEYGFTKTGVCERALSMYIDHMRKVLDNDELR